MTQNLRFRCPLVKFTLETQLVDGGEGLQTNRIVFWYTGCMTVPLADLPNLGVDDFNLKFSDAKNKKHVRFLAAGEVTQYDRNLVEAANSVGELIHLLTIEVETGLTAGATHKLSQVISALAHAGKSINIPGWDYRTYGHVFEYVIELTAHLYPALVGLWKKQGTVTELLREVHYTMFVEICDWFPPHMRFYPENTDGSNQVFVKAILDDLGFILVREKFYGYDQYAYSVAIESKYRYFHLWNLPSTQVWVERFSATHNLALPASWSETVFSSVSRPEAENFFTSEGVVP